MTQFQAIRHVRTTDRPGVFGSGVGLEEMRAGDVTYVVMHADTGLYYKFCTREPFGVWVDTSDDILQDLDWVRDKEQTAVPYDWFENMQ